MKSQKKARVRIDRIVEKVFGLQLFFGDKLGDLLQDRDYAVEKLLAKMRDPESVPTERLNCARLLLHLEESAFWEQFAQVLEFDDSADRRRSAVSEISFALTQWKKKREFLLAQENLVSDLLRLARLPDRSRCGRSCAHASRGSSPARTTSWRRDWIRSKLGTAAFLDTSIQIARIVHGPKTKSAAI